MNTAAKFFIGFATLSGFLSHTPRVVYYSLTSQTRPGQIPIWECEMMLQYLSNEGQAVHYCLMRLGDCVAVFEERREEIRKRALTALDAIKAILAERDIQAIEAKIAAPADLEKLNADFDLLAYHKESDSFSPRTQIDVILQEVSQ